MYTAERIGLMTDLEKQVVSALRLSETSAEALLTEIQTNISIARADMIRSGISETNANDDTNMLVRNVITKYVTSEMSCVESERDKAREYYRTCLDELRRSL